MVNIYIKNAGLATNGLATQYARTDVRKNSFAVRVVDKWNHLPETFKRELRPTRK
jgi:hypothetical protein